MTRASADDVDDGPVVMVATQLLLMVHKQSVYIYMQSLFCII